MLRKSDTVRCAAQGLPRSDTGCVIVDTGKFTGRSPKDKFIVRNAAAIGTLVNEHGVKVRPFPDPVYKALGDAAESFISELSGGGDDILKRIVKSYYSFRNSSMAWQQHAEQPYLNIRAAGPKFAV